MRPHTIRVLTFTLAAAAVCLSSGVLPAAVVCPFCNPVALTLSEEMATRELAVVARLMADPPPLPDNEDAPIPKALFEVAHVLKGDEYVSLGGAGLPASRLHAVYFGNGRKGDLFMLLSVTGDQPDFDVPIPLNGTCAEYVQMLPELPEAGADRLAFFQDYFEHEEDLLARDAYDEFARASYEDVLALKDRMQHGKLLHWINDEKIVTSRRRLYLTMLGVCGTADDAEVIKKFILDNKDDPASGLDAAISCYLMLARSDGLPFVEENFLADENAPYTQTYSAIMALRFHGTSEDRIPLERLKESMRLMLDRPTLADLVIPDLARWEDWTVVDKLVVLFKEADDKTKWVRVPVVQYLLSNPDPKMGNLIAELEEIDAKSVRQAKYFHTVGGGTTRRADGGGNSVPPPGNDK